ncbi:MAG: alkaline phosphatase family protein [Promethearchaeota archaeon]
MSDPQALKHQTNSFFPEYKGNSIVNLISSVLNHFEVRSKYPNLTCLMPSDLENASNIILLVIDGLGYEYLRTYGHNSLLSKYLIGKVTSVFPCSTASAMPSFYTGLAPLNHAITGWFTYLKELGVVSTILPLTTRAFRNSITNETRTTAAIFQCQSIFDYIRAQTYFFLPEIIKDSEFSTFFGGKSIRVGYKNLRDLFSKFLSILKQDKNQKFILGYWTELDRVIHLEGTKSKATLQHFQEINLELGKFIEILETENLQETTRILITADHGLIDIPPDRTIQLKDHSQLQSTLALPLCGDYRAVFFYVRPSQVTKFEEYITNHLNHVGTLMKVEDLVDQGYFGLYDLHPRFFDRVGDYVFIMKENYAFMDNLLGEKVRVLVGNHGGLSKEELYVPLSII